MLDIMCLSCDGRGTVFPHYGDRDACPTCLGSGRRLCAECVRPRRAADRFDPSGVPMCEGHLELFDPTMGGGIEYV